MKKEIRLLGIALIVIGSWALFQACATAPKLPEPKPGLYVNQEFGFTVDYPANWQHGQLTGDEVLRVAFPNEWKIPVLTATVVDKAKDAKLEAKAFLNGAKQANPGSKRHKVLSQKFIELNDGSRALALTWKWTWTDGITKLQTATVWAFKGKKAVSTNATTVLGGDTTPEILLQIAQTLKFY